MIIEINEAISGIKEVIATLEREGPALSERIDEIKENEDVLLTSKEIRDLLLQIGNLTLIAAAVAGSTLEQSLDEYFEELDADN